MQKLCAPLSKVLCISSSTCKSGLNSDSDDKANNMEEIDFHSPLGFAELPMEILLKIFRYLNFGDIQSASLACRRWCMATQIPEFRSKVLLKFTNTHLSDHSFPGNVFLNTSRSFPNIYLLDTSLGSVKNLFSHIGPTVENIVFNKVGTTEKQFGAILKDTPNLEGLSIICSIYGKKQFFKSEAGQKLLAESLRNIREITIQYNLDLTDIILQHPNSLTPNLEYLNLDLYTLSFIPDYTDYPRISIPEFLPNVIKKHVTTLKELHLNCTDISGCDFSTLANMKGLHLRKIALMNCKGYIFNGFNTLFKSQENLVEFHLSYTNGSCIQLICDYLTKLEVLKLYHCMEIYDANIFAVSRLKRLKVLDISGCDISGDGLKQGIASAKNYTLLELYISKNSDVSEDSLIRCAENLPNLRVFDISFCTEGVTDKVIQAIIKNLTWLRFLHLNECTLITDAGLTGISEKHSNEAAQCVSYSVEENEMNHMNNRIQNGLSIKELKGLKSLQLQGCYKITDVSLKYGLQFLELQKLDLSLCSQITVTGIQTLVENCPSIEELIMAFCPNINQACIEVISQRLQRLQVLDIYGCEQLITHLKYIVVNCKALRLLRGHFSTAKGSIEKLKKSGKISQNLRIDYSHEEG